MKNCNISRLFIFIVAAIAIFSLYDPALAVRSNRFTPPPNVQPPPRPPKNWEGPSFFKWFSGDIVKKFKDNKLEVADMKPGYVMGPITPRESTIFLIPSYGENIGGYVSSYGSEDNLKTMKKHYQRMNKDPQSPAWWIFERENILVLISGKIPEEKAKQYEQILSEFK